MQLATSQGDPDRQTAPTRYSGLPTAPDSRWWCPAGTVEEVEQVFWRSSPEVYVDQEIDCRPPALPPVTRLVDEKTDLLVRRPSQAALLAEAPGRPHDDRDARRAGLEPTDEPDNADVRSDRRGDHLPMVAPDRCRAYHALDTRTCRLGQVATCNLLCFRPARPSLQRGIRDEPGARLVHQARQGHGSGRKAR